MTLQELRTEIASRLQKAGIETFDYETWVFLDWKMGVGRADYYMDPGMPVKEEKLPELYEALAKREARIPLQYLMGHCEFMGYDFLVDERVLIPRQDTECLVEQAVDFLKWKQLTSKSLRILDLCTGSGCIGISLKLLFPDAQVTLADLSQGALAVAGENARRLDAKVDILQGDLFGALSDLPEEEKCFDLIISNPPYIPSQVVEGLMPEVRDHEPHMALDGTEDGLFFYRKITEQAPNYLKPSGALMYEIGAEQGQDVSHFLVENDFCQVCIVKDFAGLDRIVKGILS
ncbi:MAG: peptide chain release factor N(5)-glutamine methyltransferase [Eubacteriales bacterium]|nr:peptide chain release factor N(5)-glutamine methyltransferase [Eubacteriales bacterium]